MRASEPASPTPLALVAAGGAVAASQELAREDVAAGRPAASPSPSPTSPPGAAPGRPATDAPPGSAGRAVAAALGGTLAVFGLFALPFLVTPWLPRRVFGALPYYPTSLRRVRAVLDVLPPRFAARDAVFVDLGSGDGVAVLEAARRGLRSTGVELNLSLWLVSRLRALVQRSPARFVVGNLFEFDLRPLSVDLVMVFGVVPIMGRIERKVAAETPPHALVISHKFKLTGECGFREVAVLDDMRIYARGDDARLVLLREELRERQQQLR